MYFFFFSFLLSIVLCSLYFNILYLISCVDQNPGQLFTHSCILHKSIKNTQINYTLSCFGVIRLLWHSKCVASWGYSCWPVLCFGVSVTTIITICAAYFFVCCVRSMSYISTYNAVYKCEFWSFRLDQYKSFTDQYSH